MTPQDIRDIFRKLEFPTGNSKHQYQTTALTSDQIRIGKSKAGLPVLLIQHNGNTSSNLERHRFQNLFLRSKLESPDGNYFAIVELTTDDQDLIDWFFQLVPSVCQRLKPPFLVKNLELELDNLVDLLTSVNDPRHDLVGLWAELLLIKISCNQNFIVDAWHSDINSRWDFMSEGFCVEVKATTGDRRKHSFSLEQFQHSETLLIASSMLRESENGVSLTNLLEDLLNNLDDPARKKVQNISQKVIKKDSRTASALKFDLDDAINTLKLYKAVDIPHIKFPAPEGVSFVRYQSDLEHAVPYEITGEAPKLWAAIRS